MATNPSVTVLYIMGLWRSGSTILDIVLGSHEDVEGVGELRSLLMGWLEGATCACGSTTSTCSLWSAVRKDWVRRVGHDETRKLIALQDRFERSRSLPRLLTEGVAFRSSAFREYANLLGSLYSSIATIGGKNVVVDSTKYPGRALALCQIAGLDVRIVHLVRDGRAVIWSMRRKANTDLKGNTIEIDPQEVARVTTGSWVRTNLLSDFTRSVSRRPSIRVLYEDLMSHPRQQLDRIGELVGLGFESVADRLLAGEPLRVGHPASGNRVRSSEKIQLRPDLEWHELLPQADRRDFWRRAGWLAKRYGYRGETGARGAQDR